MTTAPVVLQPGATLPASSAILMTPVTATVQIVSAVFANTDAGVNTFQAYLVRSGGAPGPTNLIIPGQQLAPNQTYVSPELRGCYLESGDALYGNATNGGVVTVVVNGVSF